MKITFKINTGNAAFGEGDPVDKHAEVARILRNWLNQYIRPFEGANLRDSNGNQIGTVTVRGK